MSAPSYQVDPVGEHILHRAQTYPSADVAEPTIRANGFTAYGGTGPGRSTVEVWLDDLTANSFIIVVDGDSSVFVRNIKIRKALLTSPNSDSSLTLLW